VLVYQATQPSASNAYLPVDLLTLILLIKTRRRHSRVMAAMAGIAAGVTCLFRAEALLLIFLFAGWLAYSVRKQRRAASPGAKMAKGLALAFLLPAVAVPGLWVARNSLVLHTFTPDITTTGGFNLWIGNHAGASGSQKQYPAPTGQLETSLSQLRPGPSYEARRDSLFMSAALTYIRGHPAATLARDAKKLGMTLTLDVYDSRSRNVIYVGGWAILLVLGVWGWSRRVGDSSERLLLLVFLLYALAVPTVFFTLARYKLSVEIVFLLFSGCALAHCEDRVRAALVSRRQVNASVDIN
jgi:hypothetical protein